MIVKERIIAFWFWCKENKEKKILLLFGWLSYRQIASNLKKSVQLIPLKADKFLDGLAVFTIVYLAFFFFFLTGGGTTTHLINRQALRVNLIVSPLIAFALLLKRLISKKPIPV